MLEFMPLIAVVIPFLGVLVVVFVGRRSDAAANLVTAVVCAATLLAAAAMVPPILAGETILLEYDTGFPVMLSFYADALGVTVAVVSALLWLLASVYALRYMDHERHQRRFDIFSLFSLGGMMGIVLTGNLFSLYIFFELMAILSYVLVIHEETPQALRAGLKYLFMGIIGGLVLACRHRVHVPDHRFGRHHRHGPPAACRKPLGSRRLLVLHLRVRHQGGHVPAACLASRRTSCGPFAG